MRQLAVEAEENGLAVGGGEVVEGGFDLLFDVAPGGLIRLGFGLHGGGLLFVALAAGVAAAEIGCGVFRGLVQPGLELAGAEFFGEFGGLLGEGEEDGLCGIFGEAGFGQAAQASGVDPILMPQQELAEGVLRMRLGEGSEKLLVGGHGIGIHPLGG